MAVTGVRRGLAVLVVALVTAAPVRADPPAPIPTPVLQPLMPGQVIRIGPTAGTGTPTADYGIGATDLCEFMEFPTGILQICGDSFAGQGVGFGGWFSPIALHVDTDSINDPTGVRYDGVTGDDEPLLADPTPAGSSQLPAGVVSINRQNYMLVTTTRNLVPASSRLVKAIPSQGNWPTVPGSTRDVAWANGRQSQISGYYDPIPAPDSPSGWVYLVANNFDRSGSVDLYRSTPAKFEDRGSWQAWSTTGWGKASGATGTVPTSLWPDRVGEMNMKQIDGKTVLSYFNAATGNMEVRVADDPTKLGSAPVTTVVVAAPWPDVADQLPAPTDNRLAQPYGGYISPGSTLDELRVFVSQWNTAPAADNAPYRVIQFAVNPFKP